MNKGLWGWLVAAGLLLARIAYLELDAGKAAAENGAAEMMVLVLLTGGLLAGLFGITGWLGLLGWVPRPGQK
jgi:hypothetical protein